MSITSLSGSIALAAVVWKVAVVIVMKGYDLRMRTDYPNLAGKAKSEQQALSKSKSVSRGDAEEHP